MSAPAGNLPARSTLARSIASLRVKLPVISERPPEIAPVVTPGAEYTILSSTMAILPRSVKALPVRASHIRAPLPSICIDTDGWLRISYPWSAWVITLPVRAGVLSRLPLSAYNSIIEVFLSGLPQTNFTYCNSAGSKRLASGECR